LIDHGKKAINDRQYSPTKPLYYKFPIEKKYMREGERIREGLKKVNPSDNGKKENDLAPISTRLGGERGEKKQVAGETGTKA